MSKNLDKGLVISTVLNVILCMLLILTMRVESLTVVLANLLASWLDLNWD
ncbi:hypothetical protein [Staphylococcus aureus]|nr:hypothetical protein [Staphylococcus aureus]UXT56066.1 hypothetical protein MUA45_14730 [Staphylococcus aureus]